MAGYSTGKELVVASAAPVAKIISGQFLGLDFARGPDHYILTIWKDGRVIDSGPLEDFDPETWERIVR